MLFPVVYKGFWSHPNNIYLAVDVSGVKFVNSRTKMILAKYSYAQLESVGVDIVEEAITFKMKEGGPEEQRLFNFETSQKEDIANLIASYSPVHSNWHRVGEAKIKQVCVCVPLLWQKFSVKKKFMEEKYPCEDMTSY